MTAERPNALVEAMLARVADSADVYVQKIDLVREMALVVQFEEASYRSASFLDDRTLGPTTKGGWLALAQIADAVRGVQSVRPLHFIFHAGHVGSTLVSRLLDENGQVLPLREPLPLRTLAEAHDVLREPQSLLSEDVFDALLEMFLRLWSRSYDTHRCAVLKATSSAGRIAPKLLSLRPGARAVYLNVLAEPYLATLLAGRNSRSDLRGHGPERMRRLMRLLGVDTVAPLHTLSLGELAAMSWLAESATLHDTVRRFPERVVALDFDHLLANVSEDLARVTDHFGLPHDAKFLQNAARSSVLTRYAKAPEHAYSPELRAQILTDSRVRNGAEIRKGMAWLERMAAANATAGVIMSDAQSRAG